MNHEFTLVLDRAPTDAEVDALFVADEGDSVPEYGPAGSFVHVAREAPSLGDAIASAVHTVESVGLAVIGLRSDDLVTLKDIAQRTDRSYESVRLLATGKRGPGQFPPPLSTDQWALYSWTLVSHWFAQNYGTADVDRHDRQIAAADYLIRARHILAGDQRADLAKLLVA